MSVVHKSQGIQNCHKSSTLYKVGMWGAIAIIAYYLFAEHRAHLFAYLPYLILLACPFMHFFMHGSHGHNHQHSEAKEQK